MCIFFVVLGFLAVCFMEYIQPGMDKLINRIKEKFSRKLLKIALIIVVVFQFVDLLLTGFALEMFIIRKVKEYDLDIEIKQSVEEEYEKTYSNEELVKIINKFFNDKKMIRTFPNLKIQDKDGNIIYFNTLVKDVTPYYYKFR